MNRRSFLKLLGATATAAVAAPIITPTASAPLYIPSQRLDYGVPRGLVTTRALPAWADVEPLLAQAMGERLSDTWLTGTTTITCDNVFLDVDELAVLVPIPSMLLHDRDYDLWEVV